MKIKKKEKCGVESGKIIEMRVTNYSVMIA
jgi:hypothetical protein